MTGYTVHTGSNKKFTQGWDNIFQSEAGKKGKTGEAKAAKKATAKKATSKKSAKKKTAGKKKN